MFEMRSLPVRSYEASSVCMIARVSSDGNGRADLATEKAMAIIEAAVRNAAERVYGAEYLNLVDVKTDVQTEVLGGDNGVQLRAVAECPNNAFYEAVEAHIAVNWNGLSGVEGPAFVGRCDSKAEASAILSAEWKGLL